MSDRVSATARVQVTLEITPSGGGWGKDCQLDQVYKQAREEAMRELSFLLQAGKHGFVVKGSGCSITRHCNASVVGKPRVLAVVVEEPKR